MTKRLDKEGLSDYENLNEEYEEKYYEISKEYTRLGKIVRQDLEKLLEDANINVLSVTYRTKDLNKFLEKIRRKKYRDPLNEIEDICGLRIVCYYTSDLNKITSIIKKEFNVLDSVDKSQLLGEDEFGYLSRHFIVKLKKNWLNTPSYRDLGDLKAEIQLRTVLMHAWADISHKLAYKKTEQAPPQFMRQLNALSAILENADTQFNTLKNDRKKYIEEISGKSVKRGENVENGIFDINQELNLDSLQAFLDFYFSDREKYFNVTADLLEEILTFNKEFRKKVSLEIILEAYNKSKNDITIEEISILNKMDKKKVKKLKKDNLKEFERMCGKSKYFNQVGLVRSSLSYYDEDYKLYLDYNAIRKDKEN